MVGNKTVCGGVVRVDRYATAAGRRGGQAELVRRRGRRIHHVLLLHVEHGNLLLLLPLNALLLLLSCELLLLHYFLVFPQLQYLESKGFFLRLHTLVNCHSVCNPEITCFFGGKSCWAMP